ncbi:MAG: hypothetical protein ACFFD1_10310 [Candidatus Thorarchaeota archaeon]
MLISYFDNVLAIQHPVTPPPIIRTSKIVINTPQNHYTLMY